MSQDPSPVTTVDEYLKRHSPEVQRALQHLRQAIKSAAPRAEEVISYQIPTYKLNGALVHFAAFPKHCSLVVVNKDIVKLFEKELKPFKVSGTTIQFTPDHPIDLPLVKKIVEARIAQNLQRELAKEVLKKGKAKNTIAAKAKTRSRKKT